MYSKACADANFAARIVLTTPDHPADRPRYFRLQQLRLRVIIALFISTTQLRT